MMLMMRRMLLLLLRLKLIDVIHYFVIEIIVASVFSITDLASWQQDVLFLFHFFFYSLFSFFTRDSM